MTRDPRGGHNRYKVNENFFKSWSPEMAYVLGYIYADGAIEDLRKSSRTCYLCILSVDKEILLKIRAVLGSDHPLYMREPYTRLIRNNTYKCKLAYILRIGNKLLYEDLSKLGLQSRKSLIIRLPLIPDEYFFHFLRGYCDGDGCIHVSATGREAKLIFTTGSRNFAEGLNRKIAEFLNIPVRSVYFSGHAFRLAYRKHIALHILNRMYKNTENKLYLERKYKKYLLLAGEECVEPSRGAET